MRESDTLFRSFRVLIASSLVVVAVLAAGGLVATAQPTPVYYLPAPLGTPLFVTQGNDTGGLGGDHLGVSAWAYDFAIAGDVSFPVVAARAGVVEAVRTDVADGNCPDVGQATPPDCWVDANLVVIDHLDGTAALYLHLSQGSTGDLAPGQTVQRGQRLGDAGSSGWIGETALHFMVMDQELADDGAPAWWRSSIGPVRFADTDVLAVRADGLPGDGLSREGPYASGNPGPEKADSAAGATVAKGAPVAKPRDLPGRLPWAAGESHSVTGFAKRNAPDGFGFDVVAGEPGGRITSETEVFPLFGGTLRYAGCATGASAPLGRIVVIERTVDAHDFQAVFSHLSSIDPALQAATSTESATTGSTEVTANQAIGTFGSSTTTADGTCDGTDGGPTRLHVSLLRDARVTPSGDILGGRPVDPWPLQGRTAYIPVRWWNGRMVAEDIDERTGAPSGRWTGSTTRDASHLRYGTKVELQVRARDTADLREIRLLARHDGWPAKRGRKFRGLDPDRTWRLLAICRPPSAAGARSGTKACTWQGGRRSATVTYRWDPTLAEQRGRVPWLPPAKAAITRTTKGCVPVTFAFEIYDDSGYSFRPPTGKVAQRCNAKASGLGRTAYLDPLVVPAAPTAATITCTQPPGEAFYCPKYALSWQHPAADEDGFRIYVERVRYTPASGKCEFLTRNGPWLLATLPAGSKSWNVDYAKAFNVFNKSLKKDDRVFEARLSISAFNAAGATPRVTASGKLDAGDDVLCSS